MNMQTHLNTTHSGLRCNRSPEYEIILDEGKSPYCHSQILGPIVQNKKDTLLDWYLQLRQVNFTYVLSPHKMRCQL